MLNKKSLLIIFSFLCLFQLTAQETLKSYEEDYFDMLSITGETERNYINYRSLSNSIWTINSIDELPWNENNLGTVFTFTPESKNSNWFLNGIDKSLKAKVFAADFFNSCNTKAPFGQNDGALWQGRGYNSSFTTGVNVKAYGLEVSIMPTVTYSQNLDFDIIASTKGSSYSPYSYWYGQCDAPQRFGDEAFSTFDWGNTEIRYNYYNFTVGFGTQAVWLGPATQNPLLLSNNAASFPKLDIGLNRTSVYVPYFGWYLGDFEVRSWVGKLTESDYFDNNDSNNYNQFSGFSISWATPFLKGLSFGFNKVCVCKWGDKQWLYYLNPLYGGNTIDTSAEGVYGEDQKASFTIDWVLKPAGFELYSEIGVDDFPSNGVSFYEYARFPFHTMTYTVGLKKTLNISEEKKLRGILNFEWNCTEGSKDYYNWPGAVYNFGFHYQILQGYTNRGQWLGSGIGYGGNSQYLSFTLFSPHGYDKFFVARNNPDNNYVNYKINAGVSGTDRANRWFTAYKANFYIGYETMWFIHNDLSIRGGTAYNLIINPLYNPGFSGYDKNGNAVYREYTYWHNFNFNLGIKYTL